MPAHDSQSPGESKSRHTQWDKTGASMSWNGWIRLGAALLVVLGGTGGYAGFQFITEADLVKSEQKQEARVAAVEKNVEKEVGGLNTKIEKLDEKVVDVRNFQISQDARQEARRITEDIRSRTIRESEYDRLRELNEKRAMEGKDPCTTRSCTN